MLDELDGCLSFGSVREDVADDLLYLRCPCQGLSTAVSQSHVVQEPAAAAAAVEEVQEEARHLGSQDWKTAATTT